MILFADDPRGALPAGPELAAHRLRDVLAVRACGGRRPPGLQAAGQWALDPRVCLHRRRRVEPVLLQRSRGTRPPPVHEAIR